MGAFWPTILLPSDWREWDEEKLDAVLAHEFSHVARRDALTQRISLLYRAIFWFNPLAWWLNRHLAALAEQASDEAALSGGADQNHYARTLLGFFEVLQTAPRRIRWQGVSMARPGQAEQTTRTNSRLERNDHHEYEKISRHRDSCACNSRGLSRSFRSVRANAAPVSFECRRMRKNRRLPPLARLRLRSGGISAVAPIHGYTVDSGRADRSMAPQGSCDSAGAAGSTDMERIRAAPFLRNGLWEGLLVCIRI